VGQGDALTSIAKAHTLSEAEARMAKPVRFRGVVTYYDPYIDANQSSLFIHDASSGVYVSLPKLPVLPLVEGTLVEVDGLTAPGDFAPIVNHASVRILGHSHVPSHAPRVSLNDLAMGRLDCRWVEVEGLVHTVWQVGHREFFRIALSDGPFVGITLHRDGENYERWIDARVRLRGVVAVDYNGRKQMTGVHLFFPGSDDLTLISPPREGTFAVPLRPIAGLARFDPKLQGGDRVHIRGRVTLQWPGQLLCLQDDSGGVCMESGTRQQLPLGSIVDIAGFPVFGALIPALTDGIVQQSSSQVQTADAVPLTVEAALSGQHAGELAEVGGELVDINADDKQVRLTILSDGAVFPAVMPAPQDSNLKRWRVGSYLKVKGICAGEVENRPGDPQISAQRFTSFRILMRSGSDVVVLKTPSWWTPEHTVAALGGACAVTLAVFCWVMLLRRRVDQKTHELRESEERFRHQAMHDSLTGVPNRASFYEKAAAAIEKARAEHTCLGLLLLDLDHFKKINDTHGHYAGDRVLCALVHRVRAALRKVDTVARLGGDEFVVLLCDLGEAAEAEMVASKILHAVARPLECDGWELPISASIGVCVYPLDGVTVDDLLQNADAAMYRSKTLARGGVQRFALAESGDPEAREAVLTAPSRR
jgi:diguanylate cyclase (GGDEF)-like protein